MAKPLFNQAAVSPSFNEANGRCVIDIDERKPPPSCKIAEFLRNITSVK